MEFYNYGFWILFGVIKVLNFPAFFGNDISLNIV